MAAEKRPRRVFVDGLVQGVAFRYHAREEARALGLTGWIRNLADGRVETLFDGPEPAVDAFLAWLRRGPPAAHVRGIEVRDEPASSLGDASEGTFAIRR